MQINFILSLIFATFVAIFALKNGDKVLIDFLFAKVNVSQAIVIFISAILGAVIVAILGSVRSIKNKRKVKELKSRLLNSEEERKNLMALIEANSEENQDKENEYKFDKNNEESEDIAIVDK
ncbi:MAG TPA: LapA family protein [Tissierellales bacterium]|nr:LapA family protein [Tissierellales bacterium]